MADELHATRRGTCEHRYEYTVEALTYPHPTGVSGGYVKVTTTTECPWCKNTVERLRLPAAT